MSQRCPPPAAGTAEPEPASPAPHEPVPGVASDVDHLRTLSTPFGNACMLQSAPPNDSNLGQGLNRRRRAGGIRKRSLSRDSGLSQLLTQMALQQAPSSPAARAMQPQASAGLLLSPMLSGSLPPHQFAANLPAMLLDRAHSAPEQGSVPRPMPVGGVLSGGPSAWAPQSNIQAALNHLGIAGAAHQPNSSASAAACAPAQAATVDTWLLEALKSAQTQAHWDALETLLSSMLARTAVQPNSSSQLNQHAPTADLTAVYVAAAALAQPAVAVPEAMWASGSGNSVTGPLLAPGLAVGNLHPPGLASPLAATQPFGIPTQNTASADDRIRELQNVLAELQAQLRQKDDELKGVRSQIRDALGQSGVATKHTK